MGEWFWKINTTRVYFQKVYTTDTKQQQRNEGTIKTNISIKLLQLRFEIVFVLSTIIFTNGLWIICIAIVSFLI